MQILVLNPGSTSLKFQLVLTGVATGCMRSPDALHGQVTGIGHAPEFSATAGKTGHRASRPDLLDLPRAARFVLDWLQSHGAFRSDGVNGVAIRVVHGGPRQFDPAPLDDQTLSDISAASDLAPLHNGPALGTVAAVRQLLPDMPIVAVFDTAFFRDLPAAARLYAIPLKTAERYGIRRYGFHGIAHRFMAERATALLGPASSRRIITLQLGGGCSAAAILDGRPIDTTMGLTPLEGLVMATRCGDIDPSIIRLLMRKESISVDQVEQWLNEQCGLLGLSGVSADMRQLLELAANGHSDASLAVEMFCARVRKCIAAYMGVLGGADAIVFGGGIGEHSAEVRSRVCRGLEWCGLDLSDSANRTTEGREHRISSGSSTVAVFVTTVNEAQPIAADAAECLRALANMRDTAHRQEKEP